MSTVWAVIVALVFSGAGSGVSGKVRTPDDMAVPNAALIVVQGDRVLTAVTNDRGEFDIADVTLPAVVEVRASGFGTVRQQVTASPATITLRPSVIRESIIVEGTAPAETFRRPSTGTTVLTSSTLATIPAVTLDDALRNVSGFSLFRRSASRASNPTTHGVTMRGLSASGASRGLVLLDGVPLTDGFGSWVTWTRLPPLALETVEIDRGAHGATFGSDALGGVVAISSNLPKTSTGTVRLTGGDLGVTALDVAAGGPGRDSSMFGTISWFKTDGIVPTAPESAGAADVRADAEWLSAFGKIRFGTPVDQLTMTAWGSRDDRGNGTPLQRNRMSGGTFALSYERMLAGTTFGTKISFSPNSFRQVFTTVSANRATETFTSTQFINTVGTRAVAEVGRIIPKGFVTGRYVMSRTGADFTERRTSSAIVMDLRDDADAVSLHAGFSPTGRLSIGTGIRREWRSAPRESSGKDGATVGNVTASYRLSQSIVVRGAASSSHRWPTLNEMVRNFQVGAILTRANADLLPERARSVEAAVAVSGSRWSASAGGFWTVVEDAIANFTVQTTPTIIRERRNAGDAHAKGAELDFSLQPLAAVTLRASALIVDSRFRNSIEAPLEGKWLPQVPKVSASFGGDARINKWTQASFAWRSISTQFDDDRNTFLLAKARQLDLRVRFGVPMLTLDVTLENAADARIEVGRTPLVTVAPGRTVRVSATFKIK